MPKPPTVFLGHMTDREVQAFLREHQTVIVPDRLDRAARAARAAAHRRPRPDRGRAAGRAAGRRPRRAADQLRAVVPARRVHGRRPHPDPDVHGADRGPVRGPGRDRLPPDRVPQRPLRQHLRDRLRLRVGRAERSPTGTRAFPVNYWDGITAEEAAEYFGPTAGLHANKAETSAVMAIDPALVDLDAANAEMPPFPDVANAAAVHTAFFFSSPGLRPRGERVGHVGRRARVERRVRRGLPRGGDPGDAADARRHRAHDGGDARPLRVRSPRSTRV